MKGTMESKLIITSPVEGPSDALRVLLQTSLSHMADFQVMLLEVISEKYGHSVDEMLEVIVAHPKYKNLVVDPLLTELASPSPSQDGKQVKKTKKGVRCIITKAVS